MPSLSHAEIEDWNKRLMPDLHPIVRRLDELIRETIDGLQYAVKWKKAYYGLPELGSLEEAQRPEMQEWIGQAGACRVGNEPSAPWGAGKDRQRLV